MAGKQYKQAEPKIAQALVISGGNVLRKQKAHYSSLSVLVGEFDWALPGFVCRLNVKPRRYASWKDYQEKRKTRISRVSVSYRSSVPTILIREGDICPVPVDVHRRLTPVDMVQRLMTWNAATNKRAELEADKDSIDGARQNSMQTLGMGLAGLAIVGLVVVYLLEKSLG